MRRLAVLLLAGSFVVVSCSSGGSAEPTMPTNAGTQSSTVNSGSALAGEPAGTKSYGPFDRTHVDTPVKYPQNPPVGGPHNPVWQTCQFYDKPILTERGVHSMEHGAVWITYQPDLAADQVAILKGIAQPGHEILVTPYVGLPAPVVASAWGKQLVLQTASDPRLVQFVAFFENGPQTPETDTPCEHGTTEVP